MKIKVIVVVLLVVLVGLALCFCGCTANSSKSFTEYGYFGALLNVTCFCSQEELSSIKKEVLEFLSNLSNKVDESVANSDVARFNGAKDGDWVEVSQETYALNALAREIYLLTDGGYNPCVYYLVDLWGFSARFSQKNNISLVYDRVFDTDGGYPLPDKKYVEAFSLLADFSKVKSRETDGKYYLSKENTLVTVDGVDYYAKIDLGGIIKGYVVEKVGEILSNHGIEKGYVSFGNSSVKLLDNGDGNGWDVKLTNPRHDGDNEAVYCSFKAKNVSVATSGDYERYYFYQGARYSHIIDARNGKPIDNGVCSVSLIGLDAVRADALTTALCVGGIEKIIQFASGDFAKDNGIKVIATFIEDDVFKVFSTQEATILFGEKYE